MITVEVKINNRRVAWIEGLNVTRALGGVYGMGTQEYKLSNGKVIQHKFKDGARKLAIKMLSVLDDKKVDF